jgi:hypothetical protein
MNFFKRLGVVLAVMVAGLAVATPAFATPNFASCLSYNRVCMSTDINGGGSLLISQNTSGSCINLFGVMQDNISSIDNAWNDADIRAYFYFNGNCTGDSFHVGGNDAVNLNCCGRQGFNDNITSFKIRCVDLFNNCYYGP